MRSSAFMGDAWGSRAHTTKAHCATVRQLCVRRIGAAVAAAFRASSSSPFLFGTRDARTRCVKRASSPESGFGEPIKPLPVIVIEGRTPASEERPRPVERFADSSRARRKPLVLDAPIFLPFGRKWVALLVVLSVLLVPVFIAGALYLGSRRVPVVAPPRASRVDVVGQPAPRVPATTAAPAPVPTRPKIVAAPVKRPSAAFAKNAPAVKRKPSPVAQPVPRTEVKPRAAQARLLKSRNEAPPR
jgi:hypothetical protein